MTGAEQAIIAAVVARHPGLRLFVLFGSRSRGDATERSDWDFGYLAEAPFDPDHLRAELIGALRTEQIDLVDLERAGGLVRFRAARDGAVLFEAGPDTFARFWFDAVSFWCDMGPVIRAGYDAVLADLQR